MCVTLPLCAPLARHGRATCGHPTLTRGLRAGRRQHPGTQPPPVHAGCWGRLLRQGGGTRDGRTQLRGDPCDATYHGCGQGGGPGPRAWAGHRVRPGCQPPGRCSESVARSSVRRQQYCFAGSACTAAVRSQCPNCRPSPLSPKQKSAAGGAAWGQRATGDGATLFIFARYPAALAIALVTRARLASVALANSGSPGACASWQTTYCRTVPLPVLGTWTGKTLMHTVELTAGPQAGVAGD